MSVLTTEHIRSDLSVYSRPSCLSIPLHAAPAFYGSSVKQHTGQACTARPGQPLYAKPQLGRQQRPVLAQALASQVQLGWHSNFSSKFTLGPVLGRGSFGTVHEAVYNATGASYAVKVLHKTGRPVGPAHLDAIKREVTTWAQAQGSKFVAKLEGLYEDDEHAYIVSELCAGGDLKALLEANGSFSELDTAVIMRGVLDVLAECHSRNICYGDVKPANFLLGTAEQPAAAASGSQHSPPSPRAAHVPRLTVRAIDFGCSREVAKGAPLMQQCGTPLYMAPEMAMQRWGVGVDMWAAGVMMYQMLTGKLPFWPNKSIKDISHLPSYEVLAAVRTHELHFDPEAWAQLTPEARDLVGRMLERDPSQRITADEALAHPWLQGMLGYTPAPSGAMPLLGNNAVEFPLHHCVPAGSPSRTRATSLPPPALSLNRGASAALEDLLCTLSSPGAKDSTCRAPLATVAAAPA